MESSKPSPIPYRQIRATYDDNTITVYQAYSAAIASAAVREQRLNASPNFLLTRMTWIKPSWCWMMYRSDYGHKDPNQARILALKMTHAHFSQLLSHALVTPSTTKSSTGKLSEAQKATKPVRVQWDPERGPRLEVLPYRSIQIGIGRALSGKWVEEWIVGIEDVTERAERLREAVRAEKKEAGRLSLEELVSRGLMPEEREYLLLAEEVRRGIGMDVEGEDEEGEGVVEGGSEAKVQPN